MTGELDGTMLLRASYPAVRGSVSRIRHELARSATSVGASERETDSVRLAVSEAATNVVMHAYDGTGPGEIHVTAAVHDRTLSVLIADDGLGLRASRNNQGHGCGLIIIAKCADGIALEQRPTGGVEVRMRFELQGC